MKKVLYILGELSDTDIEWLVEVGEKKSIAAGSVLIAEGKPIDALYIVLDGTVSITQAALGDTEVDRVSVGGVLGEMSFIDARPPSATVTASKSSIIFVIERDELAEHLEEDAGFAARFYRAIAMLLSDRLRRFSQVAAGTMALDKDVESADELDANVLNNLNLAGARFHRILETLSG